MGYRWGASSMASALFLHGGGGASSVRTAYLCDRLMAAGLGSLAIDHTGHGATGGQLDGQSLANRMDEARATVSQTMAGQPNVIIGSSMGGHIAIRLAAEYSVRKLVLFCPAIYGAGTERLAFGPNFQAAIRRSRSYLTSPALDDLMAFGGETLLIAGDEDEVIPRAVIEAITGAARHIQTVALSGVGHPIHTCAAIHSALRDRIETAFIDFVQAPSSH